MTVNHILEKVLNLYVCGKLAEAETELQDVSSDDHMGKVVTLILQAKFVEAVKLLRNVIEVEPNHQLLTRVISVLEANLPDLDFSHRFFVSTKLKLVYLHVARCASVSTRIWMLRNSGQHIIAAMEQAKASGTYSTIKLSQNYLSMAKAIQFLGESPMGRKDFLKFAFVRNPWDRLFGGFRAKFIDALQVDTLACPNKGELANFSQQVVNIVKQNRSSVGSDGISFRDFINYVATQEDEQLDCHWCSQSYLFGGYEPDYIGHWERLHEDFDPIVQHAQRLGHFVTEAPRSSPSRLHRSNIGGIGRYSAVGHLALNEDKVHEHMHPIDFYTPELVELVSKRFKVDIERFGYTYDL